LRGHEIVDLTPKTFDMLVLLVRNSGHLLEKEELIRMLWPDTFVEEGSLSNNIFLLRKALGEEPPYIETVPKRGYRFVGAVRQLPSAEKALGERRGYASDLSTDRCSPELALASVARSNASRSRRRLAAVGATALGILAIGAALWWRSSPRLPDRSQWVQLTKFPDSVSEPALSPEGHMLAFIRGGGSETC
jgi:DNA-binding winged helix-turn-helix (wHTH) protein